MRESCVSRDRAGVLMALGILAFGSSVGAEFGTVEATAKISSTEGGFMAIADNDN